MNIIKLTMAEGTSEQDQLADLVKEVHAKLRKDLKAGKVRYVILWTCAQLAKLEGHSPLCVLSMHDEVLYSCTSLEQALPSLARAQVWQD